MTIPEAATGQFARASARAGHRQDRVSPADYEGLISCLEEAGATLLSLPKTGFSPALKTAALPILREAAEAYGWSTAEVRPAMPSASRISRMDQTFGYLALIPQDRYVLRRIVGCRALVHLAEVLGADHKAIQRWHAEGIRIIIWALKRIAVDEKDAHAERMQQAAKTHSAVQAAPRLA
jgi:hypothetical protein